MKNKVSIFAPNKPSSILLISKVVAFFFAANIGLSLPADCCTLQSVIGLGGSGGDSLSYTFIFHSQMPSPMKNVSTSNNSKCTNTYLGTKSVSIESFNIEKNEKNLLYAFLLALNLIDKFQEFKQEFLDVNPYELCLTILSEKL